MIKKNILALFVSLLCCLGVFSNTVHSETVTVNEQNQLHSGLSYQAKGNISSLADLSNGNFSVALNVTDGQEPTKVKAQLLDAPLLIGPDSTFQVKSGTINAQDSQNVQFTVNSGENIHPSLLISNVGKTQTGVALDMLVTVQDVTMTTTNDSFVRLSKGDGNVLVVQPTNLDGVQLSSQFFAHGTTNPVTFFMLPVVEDIDASQQFSMNATALGYGSNLTPDSMGLFTSTTQGVDGANDYPLGGLLYAFYGDTMLTQFNGTSNGQADPGTPGFWIFGDQGTVDKIDLTYPNSSVIFNYLDILSKHPIQTPTTLTGQQFSPFTFDAPLLNNYQLDKKANPNTPLTGSFTQTTQNFNFYYDKQSTVTVHFCDAQTGQEIQKAQVLTGYETEPYQFNVPTLNNYRYDDKLTEGSLSGNYGATNQDIKLFYHQKSSITFNLMDDTKVMSSQTLSGYSGDSYHYAAPILQNYRPANPEDYDGKFTNTVQTLNIPYQKILGNLTINYINITNNQQLLPSLNLANHVGDNTIIRVPYVDNYHQVNTSPLTVKQELPTQSQDIYYAPNPYQLLVNFVDNEGNSIKPSLTLGTTYGQNFAFEAPPIKDYQLASGQVQNFNLRPLNPIENLTIHYVPTESSAHFIFEDENGKEVAQPETISGKTGTAYHFVPPYVKYLHLTQPSQEVISGKYDGTKKTIIVRYTHLKARVDVYGVDDRGNEIKHITETGLEGQSYSIIMPAFKNLQIKNSKYQSFTGVYDSQNKVIFVLYNHIRSYLTVNLNVDGVTKSNFTVKGFIGDSFSMDVPMIHNTALTGGANHISGTYKQVHQTYDVNYYYVSSTISFNLYDSAGDYITTKSISGKYGQAFSYTLPSSVTDNYGYAYYAKFNPTVTGYFGAQNETHNVIYQYTGPHGYYEATAVHPSNNSIQFTMLDVKLKTEPIVSLANRVGVTPQKLQAIFLNMGLPPGIDSSDGTVVIINGNKYLEVYTQDSSGTNNYTLYYIGPAAKASKQSTQTKKSTSEPKTPPTPPKDTKSGFVWIDASRNFWVWDGSTWIHTNYSSLPSAFTLNWLGNRGIWKFTNGKGVNEPQSKIDKSRFWLYVQKYGIYGVMVVQNGATIILNAIPVVGEAADGADIATDSAEMAAEVAIEQELDEDGVAIVEDSPSEPPQQNEDNTHTSTKNSSSQNSWDNSRQEKPIIPTPESVANDVAEHYGADVTPLKNGYKITIDTGSGRPITVRVMGKGSGGRSEPYYRIGVDGKGGIDSEGNLSNDRAVTHTSLSPSSVQDIINTISKYIERQ